jgi:hypothetical protein
MPRARPKQAEPAIVAPDNLPLDIAAADADGGDPDPDLTDERADGGESRGGAAIRSTTGGMGPFGDPFKRLAEQMGMDRVETPDVEIPQPGSAQAITEEALARRGTTEYPDDMLVTVRLWEVNDAGVAGDPISIAHNVLYSIAKEPLTWIEYGGKWYMELIQPETKKKLVRKTFTTRGDPAPKNWRPRIGGGDEMDEQKFATAMVMALRGTGVIPNTQAQQPGLPPGAVPGEVYGGVAGGLRADITELKAKVERLEKERDDAKDAKNEAQRQRDMNQSKIDGLEREIRDLRDRERDLKAALASAPKGDGKPEWAYVVDALGKKDGADGIKITDLLRLQEKFTDTIATMKSGDGDQFRTLNGALDLVEKTRKAAGVNGAGGPGGAGDGDTLNKILGLADKAASLVQGRQRLVEIERGGRPPAQPQPQGQQGAPQRTEQDMDKEALERTLRRLEVAFHAKVNPERVGQMLASSINWAGALEFAEMDPDVKTFMSKIVQDPDKWIVWYAENLDPKIDDATEYGKAVAESFKKAMPNRPKPPPPDGGNGKAKPEVVMSQPVVSPQPAAQPGSVGGDGGVPPSLSLPVAPDASQVASTPAPSEAETVGTVEEPPKAN